MTITHKVCLCLALGASAFVAALGRPAPAAAGPPCWKALLNDWYDGRIDRIYARRCYQTALKHLPADIDTYSSARDDILRALQSAKTKARRRGTTFGPNAQIVPVAAAKTGGTTSTSKDGGETTTSAATGRKQQKGLSGLADDLDPGSASSVPLPLLVLGGLALVLVAAGATGLVVKRIQERRSQP
ncbi:MAG: hypothetical protein ACJ77E_11230 [Gaiellaceae bacterium]